MPVPEDHWRKGISCLTANSTALAHLFHETGREVVGYELDSTNIHAPMRIAFQRGAARQYGGAWINYASGNFGDACNVFAKTPPVPRGSDSWFHSKYAVTDGVSAAWYRRFYYLNYLSGAHAIFHEEAMLNQWFEPGPGEHPVQFTPFGRATEDFLAFVDRLPDRGEPYTPIAFLLNYGHSYEPVNESGKMLHVFLENDADRELRELLNVAWHPTAINEGQPQAPDVQSMPNGVYGNIFDVLVDRPGRMDAVKDYPVVWLAGDVSPDAQGWQTLQAHAEAGATLVVNIEALRGSPLANTLAVETQGQRKVFESWWPEGGEERAATPYQVEPIEPGEAQVLAWAARGVPLIMRHAMGEGAVIVTLVPRMLGLDERAHPALPYLMNGITQGLLPVEVVNADGTPLVGEIMYQLNRTKDGWLISLFNNRGIDKTQNGVARVDRTQVADVVLRTREAVKDAKEHTQPRDLEVLKRGEASEVAVRVHPGDVQVVGLVTR